MSDLVRLTGYAALFDVADNNGDTIRPGAFVGKIRPNVPLLWQHDLSRAVGVIETAHEDARGLLVAAILDMATPSARAVLLALATGPLRGLSFGYRVIKAETSPVDCDGMSTRILRALELIEVSLVSFPMQIGAVVTEITITTAKGRL